MQTNIIYNQDCVEGMSSLPDKSINIAVTSPPYNLNINYKTYKDDQPREKYLAWLDDVFSNIHRCLADDGHFWLNVGYSNIDPWVGMDVAQMARKHFILQNNFIWVKSITIDDVTSGHFKPINSDRFANATWEHLFHFTKTGKVSCDKLAVGVPYMWNCNIDNTGRIRGRLAKKYGFENIRDFDRRADDETKKQFELEFQKKISNVKPKSNLRCGGNSWFVPYDTIANRDKHRGSHPATFPIELVKKCIKFSGVKNGILLDPFMGSGTSAIAALDQNLQYIGYDIDPDYIQFAEDRIADH